MQILCDGHRQLVDVSTGVQTVIHRPDVLAEPVLEGESPVDACGATIYGSVVRDGGVFRMWYQAWPQGWNGDDVIAVACAESDDGRTWRRPNYGIVDFAGTKNNPLTDLPFHSPAIVIDPTAPPESRYRAFGYCEPKKIADRYGQTIRSKGYFAAHSADGLHWTLDSSEPFWPFGDVISAVWDPTLGGVRLLLKRTIHLRGLTRRAFYTSTWVNGEITSPISALIPDEFDDIAAQTRGFVSADYYGMGWLPTSGPTIGFLWNFRHQPPISNHGYQGRVDISLVYQLEHNGRWYPVAGRPDWLAADTAPAWANGGVYTASSALDVGDESWLYFCGTLDRHGWCGAGVTYSDWIKTLAQYKGFARIGRASWKRNRLIGCRTVQPGQVTLRPDTTDSGQVGQLIVNAQLRHGGTLRAALIDERDGQPIQGFDFSDCQILTGDHSATAVRWKGQSSLPSTYSQPIHARIELTDGTLWAFDFRLNES